MEVIQISATFLFLIGIILFLLFSSDKPRTENLYLKKAK